MRVEEALDRQERRLVDPRHHLGDRDQVPRRVAGVDALGAVAEMEVVARRARPEPSSRMGATSSSVVPGYVVDSRTTVAPRRRWRARMRAASSTWDEIGVPVGERGGDVDHGDVESRHSGQGPTVGS